MNPNWKQIVREHLAVLRFPPEREIEIVEELALHMETAYEAALADGLSKAEAVARAVRGYDWQLLECELSRAERQPNACGTDAKNLRCSVLAGAILAGIWEWDRNRDGIPDRLQQPARQQAAFHQMAQAGILADRTFRILLDGRREVVHSRYAPEEVGQIWHAERDAGAGAEPRP